MYDVPLVPPAPPKLGRYLEASAMLADLRIPNCPSPEIATIFVVKSTPESHSKPVLLFAPDIGRIATRLLETLWPLDPRLAELPVLLTRKKHERIDPANVNPVIAPAGAAGAIDPTGDVPFSPH
jgi:hypothetical protein